MNDEEKTWALVVGIDQYDEPSLRPLRGAVADACAAVGWLRKIGVRDGQIFLHAAPSTASAALLNSLQLAYKRADEGSIWGSVAALRKVRDGRRLFVFLSGHGLYDTETGRLFLTQEAGPEMGFANLGIGEYSKLFLSMAFAHQFLFLDGCQNYPYSERARPTIKAAMKSGVTGYTPKPDNTLIACYAAGQDERAVDQIDGHGAFSHFLFEAIDPEVPWSLAVDLDFATGGRTLNLRRLIESYVGPAVTEAAANQSPAVRQNPVIEVVGRETAGARCLVRLKDLPTALLEFCVEPGTAGPDVQRVSITVDQDNRGEPVDWKRWFPPPRTSTISFPIASRIPVGLEVEARCKLRPATPWKGDAVSKVTVDQDRTVPFLVVPLAAPPAAVEEKSRQAAAPPSPETTASPPGEEPPGSLEAATETLQIRTFRRNGNTAYNAFDYGQLGSIGQELAAGGVEVIHHEHGPDIVAHPGAFQDAARFAVDLVREIQRVTPAEIGVSLSVPMKVAAGELPNLRLVLAPGGAASLAGLIAGEEVVQIGSWAGAAGAGVEGTRPDADSEPEDLVVSPQALETAGSFRVEPGPTWIRVALPWGSWSKLVQVPSAGEARVDLPAKIGIAPLRVALHTEVARRETLLLGIEGEAPAGSLLRGLGDSKPGVPLGEADRGEAIWALRPMAGSAAMHRGCGLLVLIAENGARTMLPILEKRSLALDRTGGGLRAEPLAEVPLPVWDKLVASGRLESLSPEETGELIADRKSEWLLALAAAYSVHASPARFHRPFFKRVLRNLKDLAESREKQERSAPDLDLLRIALAARASNRRGAGPPEEPEPGWFLSLEATESLRLWAEAGSVPVFRWGVPLALHVLGWAHSEEPFAAWREVIAGIAPLLSPLSIWTAWTTNGETVGWQAQPPGGHRENGSSAG